MADCEWFVNRMECAIGQMRSSLQYNSKCAAAAAGMRGKSAEQCVQAWKAWERRY